MSPSHHSTYTVTVIGIFVSLNMVEWKKRQNRLSFEFCLHHTFSTVCLIKTKYFAKLLIFKEYVSWMVLSCRLDRHLMILCSEMKVLVT